MKLKVSSLIAFGIAVLAVVFLIEKNYVISKNPITISIQVLSVGLMIWARITFKRRSFHAAANPTEGKLVTNGPYRWLRHPIYAALIYFFWASVISYPFIETIIGAIVITAALFVRMILEEKALTKAYDDYAEYKKRTKRLIPYLF
ncbi:MAG: isoprenylcysteine carboxylmethyltransferase family protein [Bacteroidota bacterium]